MGVACKSVAQRAALQSAPIKALLNILVRRQVELGLQRPIAARVDVDDLAEALTAMAVLEVGQLSLVR